MTDEQQYVIRRNVHRRGGEYVDGCYLRHVPSGPKKNVRTCYLVLPYIGNIWRRNTHTHRQREMAKTVDLEIARV